jgi:5-methylcytosine-specific restriction enzyme A
VDDAQALMALKRPCLSCGKLVRGASRCKRCAGILDRLKAAKRPLLRTEASKRSNAELVADHRATIGDWCPGVPELRRPAHASADLVADHLVEVAAGGREDGDRVVRCRSCNSARSANVRRTAFSP